MIHITVCACLRFFFVNLYSSGVFCFYFNVTVHFKFFILILTMLSLNVMKCVI